MQSVSARISTRVAVFISYDDNHDTTGTSNVYEYVCSVCVFKMVEPLVFGTQKHWSSEMLSNNSNKGKKGENKESKKIK